MTNRPTTGRDSFNPLVAMVTLATITFATGLLIGLMVGVLL